MRRSRFLDRYFVGGFVLCLVVGLVACVGGNEPAIENETTETVGITDAESSEMISEIVTEQLGTEVPSELESETPEYAVTEEDFVEEEVLVNSWVADSQVAQSANQIIIVATDGSSATVSMHNKEEDGTWTEILSTDGKIGRNGIGKTKEGDGKTPTGVYRFMFGFGNMPDPGCALPYTQVDSSYYWVDDSDSAYYNQFVSTDSVTKDWDSAEHIAGVKSSYNYVLPLDYNVECVPGAGSAIFMHCQPTGGAGCIAVPEDKMVEIMKNVKDGCVVVIDSAEGVYNY